MKLKTGIDNRNRHLGRRFRLLRAALLATSVAFTLGLPPLFAQEGDSPPEIPESLVSTPGSPVEVRPVSKDSDIDRRLSRIMGSTGWFDEIQVAVKEGVVFFDGKTTSDRYRTWAGDLAGRIRGSASRSLARICHDNFF